MSETSLEYNKGYLVSQLEHLEKENLQIKKENNHLVENYFQNLELAVEQIIIIISKKSNDLKNPPDDFLKNMEYKK